MTSALLLDELKVAGLLFESDPESKDERRDWLRRNDVQDQAHELSAEEWGAELVDSCSAISR